MRRRPIDGKSITAGEVVQFLTAAYGHEDLALPILAERLRRMRRKDLDAYSACVSGFLLVLVRTVSVLGDEHDAAPETADLLKYLALELAERGWVEDPAVFVATVFAVGAS